MSVTETGDVVNGESHEPSITWDGRFIAFHSYGTNLVTGGPSGGRTFLRDRRQSSTALASPTASGTERGSSVSDDGRYVAFASGIASTTVRVQDTVEGTTENVSVSSSGTTGNNQSQDPSMSADGRFIAFESSATNLVGSDTNGAWDIFVRDRVGGTTERVSESSMRESHAKTLFLALIGGGAGALFMGGMYNPARHAPDTRKPDLASVEGNAAATRIGPAVWRVGAVVLTIGLIGLGITWLRTG